METGITADRCTGAQCGRAHHSHEAEQHFLCMLVDEHSHETHNYNEKCQNVHRSVSEIVQRSKTLEHSHEARKNKVNTSSLKVKYIVQFSPFFQTSN